VGDRPLLLSGQAVATSGDSVGRINGLFRLVDGLYFDMTVWATGTSLDLNLENEDSREVPTGPEARLEARIGDEVFALPAHRGRPALDIVGGGTVGAD
jgi:hypothetical protein